MLNLASEWIPYHICRGPKAALKVFGVEFNDEQVSDQGVFAMYSALLAFCARIGVLKGLVGQYKTNWDVFLSFLFF